MISVKRSVVTISYISTAGFAQKLAAAQLLPGQAIRTVHPSTKLYIHEWVKPIPTKAKKLCFAFPNHFQMHERYIGKTSLMRLFFKYKSRLSCASHEAKQGKTPYARHHSNLRLLCFWYVLPKFIGTVILCIFSATKNGRGKKNFPSSFSAVVGSGIRDPGWTNIRIRDKHPGHVESHLNILDLRLSPPLFSLLPLEAEPGLLLLLLLLLLQLLHFHPFLHTITGFRIIIYKQKPLLGGVILLESKLRTPNWLYWKVKIRLQYFRKISGRDSNALSVDLFLNISV